VTTHSAGADTPAAATARARRHFREIELEHALRATSAQQLRVVAARRRPEVGNRRVAVLEQAIADRLERVVAARRAAAADARRARTGPGADELAARRSQRAAPAHHRNTA
jgi:hypothetical protein